MVVTCCASRCKTKWIKGGPITFHGFPKDVERRKQWETNMNRENFKASDHTKICSLHFTDDCFSTKKFGGTWLTRDAIPTIFYYPPHLAGLPRIPYRKIESSKPSMIFEPCPRKRQYYFGDFKEDDMASPEKAIKFFTIAKELIKAKNEDIKAIDRKYSKLKNRVAGLKEIMNPKKKALNNNSTRHTLEVKQEKDSQNYSSTEELEDTSLEEASMPTIFNFPKPTEIPSRISSESNKPSLVSAPGPSKQKRYFGDFTEEDMTSPTEAKRILKIARELIKIKNKAIKAMNRKNEKLKQRIEEYKGVLVGKEKKPSIIDSTSYILQELQKNFVTVLDKENSNDEKIIFRCAMTEEEEIDKFIKSFSIISHTRWVVYFHRKNLSRWLYHKSWKCQHSGFRKSRGSFKNLDCKATITVRTKVVSKTTKKRDKFLRGANPMPTKFTLYVKHSHDTDATNSFRRMKIPIKKASTEEIPQNDLTEEIPQNDLTEEVSQNDLTEEVPQNEVIPSALFPSNVEVNPNLFVTPDSNMAFEMDSKIFHPADTSSYSSAELSQPGPSRLMEPDSSMVEEEDLHLKMLTCEVFPAEPDPNSGFMSVKIKEEDVDSDILSANVERELSHISRATPVPSSHQQSLLEPSGYIKEEPNLSKDTPVPSSHPHSLLEPPVYIKEEPLSSEEEL